MRILFVTARPPWPSRRGDQARAAGWIRELSRRHDVRVLALRPVGFPAARFPAGVVGREVRQRNRLPLQALLHAWRLPAQVALHVSSPLRRAFLQEIDTFRPNVVVPVLSRVGWLVVGAGAKGVPAAGVPAVVDLVDSLELNMENRARCQPILGALLRWEARRIASWDRRLVAATSAAAVVSQRDRQCLISKAPGLASKVHVVPFGLDIPKVPAAAASEVVLLSGNLGYFPTVDGALWFAREVWPRIRVRRPSAEWWLAGARPARGIRRLAARPGVRLDVEPDDLAARRRLAAIAIVPLRSGSGTPIKILEAMADGVPVVTTPWGHEGLDGIDQDAVSVTADADAMAEEILRLLADRQAARRQSRLAREWVSERHALGRVVEPFERLLGRASQGAAGRGPDPGRER